MNEKEIKLSSLNNVIPKVNKKEPPRSINNDLTPFFCLRVCLSDLKIVERAMVL